ncbi:hydrolase CocE/NonD family protein [Peptoanaerobacter stomatis]|uniref:Hydrolase CocE/NonD family protein n=1 Tax=Peptoanaerobacter stomatis TaxID=796937 RepID=V9HUQ7_9FIRM|nr:CocE/NonD family hydrolase [Peptoanaerobacter stomatis]EHL16663.1 hydrolase CocE/NonD family protein [Peptoanaerobacter stomatis]
MQWNLYSSGICQAKIYVQDIIYFEMFNPFSKDFYTKKILDEDENKKFKENFRIDILSFLEKYINLSYTSYLQKNEFTYKNGDIYSKTKNGFAERNKIHPHNIIMHENEIIACWIPARSSNVFLVKDGFESYTILDKWKKYAPQLQAISHKKNYCIPMRDGIKLSTDVYLPLEYNDTLPTVLVRTPYDKTIKIHEFIKYVHRGYAVVIQDVRGRSESDGEWIPLHHEVEDGDDTLNWIASQKWSNKKIGMIGGSYLGYVQWAAGASANPYLKAIVSEVTAGSAFIDMPRRGGCLISGMLAWAFIVSKKNLDASLLARDDWDEVLAVRPIEDIPKKALGYDIPFFNKWINHDVEDAFWQKGDWQKRWKSGHQIPSLIISGWFDDNSMGTTQALEVSKNFKDKKIILGPWLHNSNSSYDLNDLHFGQNALKDDLDLIPLLWFEKYLKGNNLSYLNDDVIEYYTTGSNEWKKANSWPIPNSIEKKYYLYSISNAKSSNGDGILLDEIPESGYDFYKYNPDNPATHLIDMSNNEVSFPANYKNQELRDDYLCYTTPVLKEDVIITGDIELTLYFESDCIESDLIIRICNVDEFGNSIKLADGVFNTKYKNGYDKKENMIKGNIYPISIRSTKFSHCFKKGNRIRLSITSSALNLIFPNYNSGTNEKKIVTNKVHYGKIYPSNLKVRIEK